ncbi:MAG: sugar ABC transporter ATP-binding protein [Planctomycetaceae bacterium]|nr:sugar ABC transporter ATP-binding protein [Planctomycetaceae bacterium]
MQLPEACESSAAAASPRLVMRGVSKRFGATVALAGVGLTVLPGQVHALVGENGAGKSTLMKILSGAYVPDVGSMELQGRPYRPRNPLDARRAGVSMVYQELSLAPHLSVEENIMLGMEPTLLGFVRRRAVRRRSAEALAFFEHPELRPQATVGRLSPAAQQLVEIARAMAVGCRVLVLDEPTSSLAARDAQRLFELIARLRAQGVSIIYISHFIEEVKQIADCVTVLRDGRAVGSGPGSDLTPRQIVSMMVGRDVERLYPRSRRAPGEAVLEVRDLAGAVKPLSASLQLRRGEVVGIAGLIGAGRTELLRAIFGLDAVTSGAIRVGAYWGPAAPPRRWAQGVGLVSEDRKGEGLALTLSVADNITLSRLKGLGPLGLVLPSRQALAAGAWIDSLGIRCRQGGQPVGDLSGGNQQKVALARLLQHDVDVLLLDEPTRGIDVGSKAAIYELIDRLACGTAQGTGNTAKPKAILIVSSYLPELMGVCDRVAVMCRGRLGPARPVEQLDEHSVMMEAIGQGDESPVEEDVA